MKLKGLLFLLLIWLGAASLWAQQYNYRHYTTRDGLPSSTVYSIVQDDDGYIWFSTSQGVVRFDGYKFKTFTVLDGLPDNDVLAIFKGQHGRLWFVAFNRQVSYYDRKTQTIKIFDKYTATSLPTGVLELEDGTVMIGTNGDGLCIIKGDTYIQKDTATLPLVSNVALPSLANGNVWISGFARFFQLDHPEVMYQLADSASHLGDFMKVCRNPNRTVIYTRRNVTELIDGCVEFLFTIGPYGEGTLIHFVEFDAVGNMLIATQNGAFLTSPSGKLLEHFLPAEPISRFIEDTEGNYWFCSLNDGIYMLPAASKTVNNITSAQGLPSNKILSITSLNNQILFSCNTGEIGAWEGDSIITAASSMFYLMGLANCTELTDSLTFCTSNFGALLVKNRFDLKENENLTRIKSHDSLINKQHFSIPIKPYNLSFGNIKHVVTNRESRMWTVGLTGLIQLDVDTQQQMFHFQLLHGSRGTALRYTHNRTLWFTTLDSVGTLTENGVMTMTHLDSFGIKGYVTNILEDAYQHLWFTTSGYGIYVFDGMALHNFNTEQGLSGNFITSALQYQDNLVLGTTQGVNIIKTSPTPPYASRTYPLSGNDAMVSKEVNAMLIANHLLYIATNKGISQVPLTSLQTDTMPPRVYLTRFQINEMDTVLKESYTLPASMSNIKFEYLGLLYKADGNLAYRYQMEGIDTGWIQTSFTNVQYPTMPPGDYTFKVDARSLQGPWSNKPATMQITILPPFWKTWWFSLAMALVIGGTVTGISYAVIRYYKNQSQVAQRMVELEGQALRANMNPHFVFNALNAIHDFIADQDEKSAHIYLGKFAKLIRGILDQSRKNFISLEEEIETLNLYLEAVLK